MPPISITNTAIHISGLRIFANHGLLKQEQVVGNEYLIDATLQFDARQAMIDDKINNTINYATAVKIIQQEMTIHSDLLENLAQRIATALIDAFPILEGGSISITKIKPPFSAQLNGITFSCSFTR